MTTLAYVPINLQKSRHLWATDGWIRRVSLTLATAVLTAAFAQPVTSGLPLETGAFAVSVDPSKDEFCLIVVPDTQRYAAYFPGIFRRQFQWIRDNVVPLNVKFVMHVGDVVEEGEDSEWVVADEAFSMIDGVVPYLVVPGNHDISRESRRVGNRDTTKFNAVFSPKRFAGRSWYGGSKGVTGDNSFAYFNAGGQEFMVLGLEYGPTDETLAWADHLVDNHADRHKVILVTHSYMNYDNTRTGEGDNYSPHETNPKWNDGEQIWQKLVSRRTNFVMVLSGHVKDDGTGVLVSATDAGTPVLQMLANYQFLGHGGEGWLRILKFRPEDGKLDVFTFSPWLGRLSEEPDQRFTIDVPWMFP